MLLCLIADTHCGCRNSSEVIQDHQNRFYKEIFFPYLKQHGIKNIIHLGDFFDNRKFLSIKSLHSNRKAFLEPLRDEGIHMDIILGNHDVHYKTTNDVNSLKEVFGFFVSCIDIISEPTVLKYGSASIGALPWIAPDNADVSAKFIQTAEVDLLVSHLELAGFEMMKGAPAAKHGMDPSIFSRFPLVCSGHYHTKSSGGNIEYLGTPFELTWADCHDPKYFHVYDTETKVLTPVRNPLTLHRKIYYTDEVALPRIEDLSRMNLKDCFVKLFVVKKKDYLHYEKYLSALHDTLPHELKISEIYTTDTSDEVEDVPESTEDLLHLYVDNMETQLDKTRMKTLLSSIYREAESAESL